jgi:hypothetical protein
MNERIKQLALEADLTLDDLPDNILIPLENFAESIVQEIIAIVQDSKNYNSIIYTTHDRDQANGIVKELVKSINSWANNG